MQGGRPVATVVIALARKGSLLVAQTPGSLPSGRESQGPIARTAGPQRSASSAANCAALLPSFDRIESPSILSGEAATASSPSSWKAAPRACRQPINQTQKNVAVVSLAAIIQAPSRKHIVSHYIWQYSATDRFMRICRASEHNSMWTFNIR